MKKELIDDVIADCVMRPAKGWIKGKKKVYIAIGRPRHADDPGDDWICPIYIEKFMKGVTNAHGIGPLDALLNAMNLLQQFLYMNTVVTLEPIKTKKPVISRMRQRVPQDKNETELKQNCDLLKQIASRYPDESAEMLALKKAALALQLVFLKGLGAELNQWIAECDKPLTKGQRDNLKRMGL